MWEVPSEELKSVKASEVKAGDVYVFSNGIVTREVLSVEPASHDGVIIRLANAVAQCWHKDAKVNIRIAE